jgi:hypothetical protein
MNIVLEKINIQKIINESKKILEKSNKTISFDCKSPGDLKGFCGLGRDIIYWSAIINNIPKECILLLQIADFLKYSTHGFTVLILDKLYLCDLTFSQFVANLEELEIIDKKYDSSITNLYDNGYVELTENNLLSFFIFCSRDLHEFQIEEKSYLDIEEIKIYPVKSSGSFLQQVLTQKSEEPDYTIEELNL